MMVCVLLESNTAGDGMCQYKPVSSLVISIDIPVPSWKETQVSSIESLRARVETYPHARGPDWSCRVKVRYQPKTTKNPEQNNGEKLATNSSSSPPDMGHLPPALKSRNGKATHQVDVDFRVTKRTNS